MSNTRRRRDPRVVRQRDRIGLLLVVLAAVVAGVVAGSLASPQPWQAEPVSVPK